MGRSMKNPWLSAYLSAANTVTNAARGQMMAEFSKAQTQMMQDWQRMWIDAAVQIWFPTLKPKKRGS